MCVLFLSRCVYAGFYFCDMEADIPVTFEFNGKEYKGFFSRPKGAGDVWYLTVQEKKRGKLGNYHWGQLFRADGAWRYADQTRYNEMLYLSDYFGDVVTAWYS